VTAGPAPDEGIRRVAFTVPQPEQGVPAVLWLPARAAPRRPLVLIGHGGAMHKETPFIVRVAHALASGPGYACLAIDLPLHGERTPPDERGLSPRQRRARLGLDAWRARNEAAAGQAVADWRAALDAAASAGPVPPGPVGYLGLSMGTRFGVPLIAAEPRISAAFLGLFGVGPADHGSAFAQAARQVSVPVLFLMQWDDELFPRDDGLALFDLLGSPHKTLHASPGSHLEIPPAELKSGIRFLGRHLGPAG
jgi:dienelactone hydrolase